MRDGDKPIEERLETGEVDISLFFPTNKAEKDMVKAREDCESRRYIDELPSKRSAWSSLGVPQSEPSPRLPSHVVTQSIEIAGPDGKLYRWEYHTNKLSDGRLIESPACLRRVFALQDQVLSLNIDETLFWLCATRGSPQYEKTLEQLGKEIDLENNNNHIILQLMEQNIREGRPMLQINRTYEPIRFK